MVSGKNQCGVLTFQNQQSYAPCASLLKPGLPGVNRAHTRASACHARLCKTFCFQELYSGTQNAVDKLPPLRLGEQSAPFRNHQGWIRGRDDRSDIALGLYRDGSLHSSSGERGCPAEPCPVTTVMAGFRARGHSFAVASKSPALTVLTSLYL
jgi:hypothetical protein